MMFWNKGKRAELVFRENLELSTRVRTLEEKLDNARTRLTEWAEAKNVECNIWRERGDKYCVHNNNLQVAVFKTLELINAKNSPQYKDLVERLIAAQTPSKK